MNLPDFALKKNGLLSQQLLGVGIRCFSEACTLVRHLPYGRNTLPLAELVMPEGRGTCSTKHAFLAGLIAEAGIRNIHLAIGLYRMCKTNTPGIGTVLDAANIAFLPEAHTYLKYDGHRYDFSSVSFQPLFKEEVLEEVLVDPDKIGPWKVNWHKEKLEHYRSVHLKKFRFDTLWNLREACIGMLSKQNNKNEP